MLAAGVNKGKIDQLERTALHGAADDGREGVVGRQAAVSVQLKV